MHLLAQNIPAAAYELQNEMMESFQMRDVSDLQWIGKDIWCNIYLKCLKQPHEYVRMVGLLAYIQSETTIYETSEIYF
jgi:hypothetical protein